MELGEVRSVLVDVLDVEGGQLSLEVFDVVAFGQADVGVEVIAPPTLDKAVAVDRLKGRQRVPLRRSLPTFQAASSYTTTQG